MTDARIKIAIDFDVGGVLFPNGDLDFSNHRALEIEKTITALRADFPDVQFVQNFFTDKREGFDEVKLALRKQSFFENTKLYTPVGVFKAQSPADKGSVLQGIKDNASSLQDVAQDQGVDITHMILVDDREVYTKTMDEAGGHGHLIDGADGYRHDQHNDTLHLLVAQIIQDHKLKP